MQSLKNKMYMVRFLSFTQALLLHSELSEVCLVSTEDIEMHRREPRQVLVIFFIYFSLSKSRVLRGREAVVFIATVVSVMKINNN